MEKFEIGEKVAYFITRLYFKAFQNWGLCDPLETQRGRHRSSLQTSQVITDKVQDSIGTFSYKKVC